MHFLERSFLKAEAPCSFVVSPLNWPFVFSFCFLGFICVEFECVKTAIGVRSQVPGYSASGLVKRNALKETVCIHRNGEC